MKLIKISIVVLAAAVILSGGCRTQPPAEAEPLQTIPDITPPVEDKSPDVMVEEPPVTESPSALTEWLPEKLYRRSWYEERLLTYPDSLEGSMIAPGVVPLLPSEISYISNVMEGMSLNEKIGQLFVLDLRNHVVGSYFKELGGSYRKFLGEFHAGGFVFYADNIKTGEQVSNLIWQLNSLSSVPPFLAIDQEGGRVSRLNSSSGIDVSDIPAHRFLGDLGNPDYTWRVGRITGNDLKSLGFNLDFAPVADINSNPDNPVIGDRAFSDDREVVSQMVRAFTQGLQEVGVCSVIKHFPGHGDTSSDPHSGEVSVNRTLDELESFELAPFRAGIEQGAAGVMTAHILTPDVKESDEMPATLSPFFLEEILRKEIGFTGLIISDSFSMGAVRKYRDKGRYAVLFLQSGGDLILRPPDPQEAAEAVRLAVENGELSENRIDESVRRILEVKYRFGFFSGSAGNQSPDQELNRRWLNELVNSSLPSE